MSLASAQQRAGAGEPGASLALARQAIVARGAQVIDLPSLLPSALVLELAGENLRPRLFFTTAPDGTELCLRADLTIPAALHYVQTAQSDDHVASWLCEGKVFRAPRAGEDRSPEFVQLGLERFGDQHTIGADVDVFLAAFEACQALGVLEPNVRFCDGGLLPSVLSQAQIPEPWKQSLIEVSQHPGSLRRRLKEARGDMPRREISALERTLAGLETQEARATVGEVLSIAGLALPGARTLNDVADRLAERARRVVAPSLDHSLAQAIDAIIGVRSQPGQSEAGLDQVTSLAAGIGVDLAPWRQAWQQRLDRIASDRPRALALSHFEGVGPEMFDYYDGFIFDLDHTDTFMRPIASGGRYDQLVQVISDGQRRARAVGFVVRPSRIGGA
jgi:ATP phosphoribosyltransferase regulatory subunit